MNLHPIYFALLTSSASLKNKTNTLLLAFLSFFAFSTANGQEFIDNTPGTRSVTVPPNVTSVTATVWGGGGGGGGSTENRKGGSGGGSGGYFTTTFSNLPASITYTVGGGGNGTNDRGTDGGLSKINVSGIEYTANGGGGGSKNCGAVGIGGLSINGIQGNNGIIGTDSGGKGGDAPAGGGIGGNGGEIYYIIITPFGINGGNGASPGAGGGGGVASFITDRAGGKGANGRVSFKYISVSSVSPSSVCAGSVITITGTNFARETTTVTINGIACTNVSVVNNTTITATVGLGTAFGTHTVVIDNPNGTNNGKTITIGTPTLSISPTNTTVCKNSIQPIVATASGGSAVTWSPTTNLYTNAACTIPYTAGTNASNVWAKPSATTTYTATATNGACSKTAEVSFKIETADWNGTSWNTPPDANKSLLFAGDYNSNTDNRSLIEGCDCTVTTGAVTIASDHVLKLKNELDVTNRGSMTFENNATLLQINNVINTGNITYKRTAANIKGPDFVYWSSPVIGQTIGTIYSGQGPKYSWDTLADNGNGANDNISQGSWTNTPATMTSGIGYIIRGSSSFGMGPTAINSVFTGVPANGLIQATLKRGAYIGPDYLGANGATISNLNDNLNLLGNPYPSAIDAVKFLEDNKDFIEGNVKLWMHGSAPSSGVENPFYGSFTYNYSASDYVTINATGSTDKNVKPIIRAGQGFFVTMKDGPAGDAKVSFQNTQRNDNGNAYANNEFFRTTTETVERNRIWLDLVNANNSAETTLIGYVTGATEAKESAYDALASELPMGIYSILADEKFVIQGRSLPFDTNDQVAIGYNVATAGTYKLALNFVDGLFADAAQNIYIEDTITGSIHDLKASPYSFTTAAGTFKTRFVLRYTYETLGMEDFTAKEVKVYANESINVSTAHQSLQTVKVYDLQGRVLGAYKNINATTFSTYAIAKTQTALIVEVVLENGATQSYKVIY